MLPKFEYKQQYSISDFCCNAEKDFLQVYGVANLIGN